MYHALILDNCCIIRNSDDGINATEWEMGVRKYHGGDAPLKAELENHVFSNSDMTILTKDEWNNLIYGDEKEVQKDHYNKTVNKWAEPTTSFDRSTTNMRKIY